MNIASEALMHSPDNNTSPAQNYTIVNYRPRGTKSDSSEEFEGSQSQSGRYCTPKRRSSSREISNGHKFSQPSREKLRKKRTMAETTRSVSLNVLVISTEPENITKQSIITLKILLTTKLTN
ncbi:hypothetical protein GLOIN_2v1762238 [Rhizophagus irregularis DAOM 181602=DAOM 197198]|nr:hypothetical protein GLOIN_2v1762238 [Rhizophagus irregularis DAOM 181602=DAOM 197198]